jgi:uncharacterized peroxidase-related enzyme
MTASVRDTFTIEPLAWSPWLERATDTALTAEQRQRVEAFIGDVPHSDYLDVLSNDLDAAQARALVHRHVYTSDDPAHGARRELGATTTSRINGCVYCASVHARRYAQYSKQRELIERFLTDGVDVELPPVERAIVDITAQLTHDPESLAATDLQPLRDLGFDDLEILDILNYAAFFANANRLMLTLGEPVALPRRSSS